MSVVPFGQEIDEQEIDELCAAGGFQWLPWQLLY